MVVGRERATDESTPDCPHCTLLYYSDSVSSCAYDQSVMPEGNLCSTPLRLDKPPKSNMHRVEIPGIGAKKETGLFSQTQNLLPTRGTSARYAREFIFARCHDEAGAIILILLHCCPAGNTPRTGQPSSPAAKRAELNDVGRFWRLEPKEKTKDCCA